MGSSCTVMENYKNDSSLKCKIILRKNDCSMTFKYCVHIK